MISNYNTNCKVVLYCIVFLYIICKLLSILYHVYYFYCNCKVQNIINDYMTRYNVSRDKNLQQIANLSPFS